MRFRVLSLLASLTLFTWAVSGSPVAPPKLQQANGDSYTFPQGSGPSFPVSAASGLLANDVGTGLSVTGNTPLSGPLIGSNSVTVNSDGSFTFFEDPSSGQGTDTFTYTVSDGTSATVYVTVGSPPSPFITSFTASPTSILFGQSSTLSWTTAGATSVSISPAPGSVAQNGSAVVSPSTTTTYTLTATNSSGTTTGMVTVGVTPCPTITVNPGSLPAGTVGAAYSQTISATGGSGPYTFSVTSGTLPNGLTLNGSSGALSGSPTTSGIFTFTIGAFDTNGCTGSRTYSITISAPPPTIDTFRASPALITAGQSSTLSWTTSNATSVTIDNGVGSVAVNGSAVVSPTATTTYTLTATNGAGTTTTMAVAVTLNSGSASISVTPATVSTPRLRAVTLEIRLSAALGADTRVTLTSTDTSIATVPSEVIIPAGRTFVDLSIATEKAGRTTVTASLPGNLGGSSASATITVDPIPAKVVVTSFPAVLTEIAAQGGSDATAFSVSNVGDLPASVNINISSTGANFFTVSPSSFSLGAGATEVITVTAPAQPLPGSFLGAASVLADGSNVAIIPVKLLAFAPSGLGIPNVLAITSRVDIAAPRGTNPSGVITYRNTGTTRVAGLVSTDVIWIIPAPGIVTIDPGQTVDVPFQIDRSKQPDAASASGSIQGNATLVYEAGSTGARLFAGSTAGTSLVVPITDTRQPDTAAQAVPPLSAGEVALLIPGVGHVTGSGGKEFISDVSIVNSQSTLGLSDVKLFYSSASATVSSPQPLAANQSLQLADAINTYFKQGTSAQGTLHIRSKDTSRLAVSANVFNKANPKGTYGTAIPVFRSNRVIAAGEKLYLTGLRKDATAHTNLYLQEMSGTAGSARIEFFDEAGVLQSSLDSQVSPFNFTAVGSVVPSGAVMARVTNTSLGKLEAYATPVDDASGDTWAVADWDRQYGLTGSEGMLVPVAGFAPGANGANFRTDLALTNIGSGGGTLSLTYYPGSGSPVTRSLTMASNQTRSFSDVAQSFFNVAGVSVGSIVTEPQSGSRFVVTSRTYTASATDPATYGTGVPTLPLSGALKSGQSQIFGGIEDANLKTQNAGAGNTYRTNLALVETAGGSVTVRVSVFFADGTRLVGGGANGERTLSLTSHQFLQLNGVVRQILGTSRDTTFGDLHNVQVKIDVLSGTGAVVPFITATDNGTNDTVLRTE